MKFEIRNRFSREVQFTAEIDCDYSDEIGTKIGLAVLWAVKTGANLEGANLKGANLRRAMLAGAMLAGANLIDANLVGACLADANFVGANLDGACLNHANLIGACLNYASLDGANLVGANLDSANLVGTSLVNANLVGTRGVIDAGTPNGWRCVGWLRDEWLSVRVGCHDKRVAEGRQYWARKANRTEVLAALDYVEAVARLRGWALIAPMDR